MKRILVTDCGSTTTKAILFEKLSQGWRMTGRGEAPTTVESPVADVTVGVRNAFEELEATTHSKVTDGASTVPIAKEVVDMYLSTSSAGGGLQMAVGGIVKDRSAKTAARAALGAGAIVLDTFSFDDGRDEFERIEQLRQIRPDIFLLAGGTDGGGVQQVELAEMIRAAAPQPRFGESMSLPVIYAGNTVCSEEIKRLLSQTSTVACAQNVQPNLENENLKEARDLVHELFLTHVMSHAPGYKKLLTWTPKPILPTPSAVGNMIQEFANRAGVTVLCADIGGATTDIFSAYKKLDGEIAFSRTVSANLGMSYSIGNVLAQAGIEKIVQWLPYAIDRQDVKDRIRNKMIRPTTIPQNKEDLWLEQAVCREALRLSYEHHLYLTQETSKRKRGGIADIFNQNTSFEHLDPMMLDIVIGSGGVLSHAPRRIEAVLMMVEGFGLQGITEIAVDSVFMLPHLGVLATVSPEAAYEIFEHDCLIRLGVSVVPVYPKNFSGNEVATVFFNEHEIGSVKRGKVELIKPIAKIGVLKIIPKSSQISVGREKGKPYEREVQVGSEGILLDGRNRPIQQPNNEKIIFESVGML